MTNAILTKSFAILIAISIIAAPLPVYSQDINGGTYMEGLMQGQMAAEGNAGWILGGFCCNIFGIGGAYLIEPSIFQGKFVNVQVEENSLLTRGKTVVDWWGVTGRSPNCYVMIEADHKKFFSLLSSELKKLN